MDMRGLSNFIADIRKATGNRDEEVRRVEQELGKIRSKFRTGSDLSPYDRKKYMCKLLFIFMLGYEVDFGHMEALSLLAGQSATEKLVGYLSISLLLHEQHPLMTLATHTIHNHLVNGDADLDKSLAMTAIANVGGRELCDASAPSVQLIAAGTFQTPVSSRVQSKAFLTCLRLHRKYRGSIDAMVVGPAAVRLVTSHDMSQAACALSLIVGLLSDPNVDGRSAVAGAREACMRAMHRIIMDRDTQREYMHFSVPAPWFQVKALRCLQFFPPPESLTERQHIETVLLRMVRGTENVVQENQRQKSSKGANSSIANRCNAMVAALVEIVSLAIEWDFSESLLTACQDTVALLLKDKRDANMRYLGLLLLSRLSYCPSLSETVSEDLQRNHSLIVSSLHDADNSIRRQALNLLYAMCDRSNAAEVLGELLAYLPVAQVTFKEDLVLMIAVLAEKFCTELTWYVDVVTSIVEQAGDYCTDDVWQRLCHVIVNAPSVQKVAVEQLFKAVSHATQHNDVLLRTAGFILGEAGYQIALAPGSTPIDQLNALHTRFPFASDATKAVLLTTYLKFYNLYDNAVVREKIIKIFRAYRSSFDAELQIRAAEYLALVTQASDDVLQQVLEALPPFDLAQNAVLGRLRDRTSGGMDDRNIWSEKAAARDETQLATSAVALAAIGIDQTPKPEETTTAAAPTDDKASGASAAAVGPPATHFDPNAAAVGGKPPSGAVDAVPVPPVVVKPPVVIKGLDDLLDVAKPTPVTDGLTTFGGRTLFDSVATSTGGSEQVDESAVLRRAAELKAANTDRFVELSVTNSGVLHVDNVFRVHFKVDFRVADCRIVLKFDNVSGQPVNFFECKLANEPPKLIVQLRNGNQQGTLSTPGASSSTEVQVACRAAGGFDGCPSISVTAQIGSGERYASTIALPIAASRFVEPYQFTEEAKFRALWETRAAPKVGSLPASYGAVVLSDVAKVTTSAAPTAGSALDDLLGGAAAAAAPPSTTPTAALLGKAAESFIYKRAKLHTMMVTDAITGDHQILAMGAFPSIPVDAVKYEPVMLMAHGWSNGRGVDNIVVRCNDAAVERSVAQQIASQASRAAASV